MGTKVCYTCKLEKPLSEFHKNKANKDGLQKQCKVCHIDTKKAYRENNKERVKATQKAYLENNKERYAALKKAWRQENRDKVNAYVAHRKATKLQATPLWANNEAIIEFYECAFAFRLYTGLEYHVDHIVPLNSKKVCGLHCESNLQVLEARTNLGKGNRWWPDMP